MVQSGSLNRHHTTSKIPGKTKSVLRIIKQLDFRFAKLMNITQGERAALAARALYVVYVR